jgi:hypothetical protein
MTQNIGFQVGNVESSRIGGWTISDLGKIKAIITIFFSRKASHVLK